MINKGHYNAGRLDFSASAAVTEADDDCLMRTIDQAALALVKAEASDCQQCNNNNNAQHNNNGESSSECFDSPVECRRLRVLRSHEDETTGSSTERPPQRHVDLSLTSPLPATQKRAKDEVDVAAAGIPLEVRRLQCTKSTLALKEATKNDATLQSVKLVDFIVSLTWGDNGLCTEREMCQWLVAQMCDRMETGQIWIVAKTLSLLFVLLWRGSNSFVQAAHEYGAVLFQAQHIAALVKSTPQENLSGERLPCSLQPIKASCGAQASGAGKPKTPSAQLVEKLKMRACTKLGYCPGDSGGAQSAADISEDEMNFMYANTAYMESLCEYRMRHPTLDLAHGAIVMAKDGDAASMTEGDQKTHSPAAWKELLDDTLELMKAIAVTDPRSAICPIGVSVATMRMRNAVLLYQIACRALVRVLHAVVSMLHTFVVTLQAGLQVPSSRMASDGTLERQGSSEGSGEDYFGADVLNPTVYDYSLSPELVHRYTGGYYSAIYQFNRTVNMLKVYCESAEHVDPETATRALAAFKTLPEACILEFKASQRLFTHPACSKTITKLHQAAQQSAEMLSSEQSISATGSNVTSSDVSSPVTAHCPLRDEEVRQNMLDLYHFHTAKQEYKQKLWKDQVEAVCSLFDPSEASVLRQVFTAGLTGLWQQWDEFTNNGAAAAEKALMTSADTKMLSEKQDSSELQGISASENSVSDYAARTSTYILRSLPAGVKARAGSAARTDVITLTRSSSQSVTESSIDALLREDDVVVICNEECSCNDTLKLVDRFQVLLDVPLGEGSYGKVYRAWDEVIGCYLAAKELPLDASKAHNVAVREVLQEYTVLTELSHPNIVRVVAFMVLKQTARIYMEWMPSGSLQDVLRHHPRGMLRESVVRRYARDVLSGLAFLHSRGVIHRDVKPGNMLLSSDGAVKLTDFGTSLVLSGNSRTLESNAVTGTAAYMAPESVQGIYSSASDIWSFGCSILQLVTGNVPWFNNQTKSLPEPIALLFKIGSLDDATHLERPHDALKAPVDQVDTDSVTAEVDPVLMDGTSDGPDSPTLPQEVTPGVSAELLAMLDAIFVVDRKKRPSASELMQHPFLKEQ